MTDSNQFYYSNLYTLLEKGISEAQHEVLLVAPFIKKNIIEKLLNTLANSVKITVITRWRIEEILSGVSDIEIYELLENVNNGSVKLYTNLHAKYYRFDQTYIFGSANLTQKALVGSLHSNLEILFHTKYQNKTEKFEEFLLKQSVDVSLDYYTYVKELVAELKTDYEELVPNFPDLKLETPFEEFNQLTNDLNYWFPKSRNPENLYEFYKGNKEKLTKDQLVHAQIDFTVFPIPPDLNKDHFKKWMGFYLIQMPLIEELDDFLDKPRRFGEISSFCNTKLSLRNKGEDPQRFWQTLMRWLLFFIEDKYEYKQPRYSEIFRKK